MKGRGLIRAELLTHVSELLSPHGFTLVRSHNAFDREEGDVRCRLHLLFHIHFGGPVEVTAEASVRFHSLEDLKDRLCPDPLVPEEDRLRRATLGKDLGSHMRGFWQKNWKLTDKDQVPETAAKIANYLARKGLPFLEEYSDKSRALEILSRDDNAAKDVMVFDDERAKNAIGLAYLMYGADRARQVANVKLTWLRNRPHADREGVARWVEKLLSSEAPSAEQ